jgi:Rod binding domain-containing protein
MGHRRTHQQELEKGIGTAFKAMRQVESVAWRLASESAGARENAQEKRHRRMSPDSTLAIVLARWHE